VCVCVCVCDLSLTGRCFIWTGACTADRVASWPAARSDAPAPMERAYRFGRTTHSSTRSASVQRGRELLISLRVCRVGLTPSYCMYKQGAPSTVVRYATCKR